MLKILKIKIHHIKLVCGIKFVYVYFALQVLCFHLGMTESFIWDKDTEDERFTDWRETVELIKEIHHEFVKDDCAIQYSHQVGILAGDGEVGGVGEESWD